MIKNGKPFRKKFVSVLAALALTAGCLSGCGGQPAAAQPAAQPQASSAAPGGAADTSKEVTLKMYLLGDKAADFDKVYAKISDELKKKINATLEVQFLSWAEHDTKYSLLFSSGEDFDLIFTASGWGHYEQTAVKKGFYEMTDQFRSTYAPDIMKILPEEAWEQARIDGKIYMVPNYSNEYGSDMVAVRGDLMSKYGIQDIKSTEDLEKYFDSVVKNEKGITPLGTQGKALQYLYLFENRGWSVAKGTPLPLFIYEYTNPSNSSVVSVAQSDEFRQYARKMKAMQDKGYWSKDALSTKDTRSDNFVAGKAAAMVWNLGSCVSYCQQVNKDHPDWKATVVDISPDTKKQLNPYTNNGIAINANSKNPERAMMAVNQFMTNKTIYDLAAYGIEGEHYKAEGDDQYSLLDATSRFPVNGSCNWGWNNENLMRDLYEKNPDPVLAKQKDILKQWDTDHAKVHPLDTFSFNEENVKSQDAVLGTLVTQYMDPISTGLVDDPDKAVDEFISKLKAAGIEDVTKEIQSQASAFAKGK